MPGLPRRGAAPRTSTPPAERLVRPRMTRRSEVLPDPFGPRMATNAPGSNVRDRSDQIRRPRYSRVAPSKRTRGSVIRSWRGERLLEVGELGELPVLVRVELGRDRLGYPHDRNPILGREVVDRLGRGRGDLAVVEQDLHGLRREQ